VLWPVTWRDQLQQTLSAPGRRDVANFSSVIGTHRVDFPTAKWDPFLNVNTPDDLAAARSIAEGKPW
jgi:molybdenum cofactor guanylyltransferase